MKISANLACLLSFAAAMAAAQTAFAGPECTKEPKDKWKNEKTFQEELVKEGYKIKKFKVTDGQCYEIYGMNKEGKKVEIYYNPVTGAPVKQEIHK